MREAPSLTIVQGLLDKGAKVLAHDPESAANAKEGCLSFPDIKGPVERASTCKVSCFNLEGEELEIEADEMLARCFLHEVDHLNGLFFVDKMSPADRLVIEP